AAFVGPHRVYVQFSSIAAKAAGTPLLRESTSPLIPLRKGEKSAPPGALRIPPSEGGQGGCSSVASTCSGSTRETPTASGSYACLMFQHPQIRSYLAEFGGATHPVIARSGPRGRIIQTDTIHNRPRPSLRA